MSKSLWVEVPMPSFPPLKENLTADVCIIGAGIAGLTCAYTLAKAGKSVVVIDQGPDKQTYRTTAHLTWVLDDRFYHLERLFGEEGARLAAESHAAAIDKIEKIVEEEKISCDFERLDGFLFPPPEGAKATLEKEYAAIQKMKMDVEWAPKAPFSQIFDTGRCLRFPKQAQFHILKYLKGLIHALSQYDCKIFHDTRAIHYIKTLKSGLKSVFL